MRFDQSRQHDFEDRVVVVTGAGRNLGREYALAFAASGARVVVNDLGVAISDTDGAGQKPLSNPADEVVGEIVARGGDAVPNYDSIATPEGGRSIIDCALDAYGRVDAVVNNAGQVRMAPFEDFPEESIDDLVNTQLRGTLNVSRPAWRYMKKVGFGRIVNVSSGAAFGGVPNGTVYAMAKMGVIGLTRGMASEGASSGIRTNVIVPYAKTRPGTGFGPIPWSDELGDWLHPRHICPLTLWLAHEECSLNGEAIAVGAGWNGGVSISLAEGYRNREATMTDIATHIDVVLSGGETPLTPFSSRAVRYMMDGFDGLRSTHDEHADE